MRPSNFALLLSIALMIWQSRVFAQVPTTPAPATTHPAALALLDTNLKTLTRSEGVEVRFQQTILGRGQPAVINGLSVTADQKRARVELNYKQVERTAHLKLLCDGTTFYRLELIDDQNSLITYSLKELQEALDHLATNETERVAKEDVEKEQQGMHGFEGVAALVKDLKVRMTFGEPVATTIDLPGKPKHPVKVIEGRWTNEVLDMIAPPKKSNDPNQQDQRYLWNEKLYFFSVPRQAKLYFDATNQQLLRIELLGIIEKQGPEKVLSYVDFQSITPLASINAGLFQPTEEELKFKRVTIDLAKEVKNRHQSTLNILKMQQQMQK